MKKRIGRKGKQMIPVMNNKIYSALLFEIASGNNYAQKIYDSIKKPTSIIVRQLKILEDKDFVTSVFEEDKSTFPMKRLNIYSINWDKIIQEFVSYVFKKFEKEFKDHQKIDHEGTDEPKEKVYIKLHKKIKDKDFESEIKNNEYLKALLKITFSISENSQKTIKEIFEDLKINLPQPEGTFIKHPKEFHIRSNTSEASEYLNGITERTKKDEEYQQFKEFIKIARGISDSEGMQGIENLWNYLQLKYTLLACPNNEITKKLVQSSPGKILKHLIENHPDLKDLIQKTKENGFNATKPTENIENKSGDTDNKSGLSSETKQEVNSK